MVRTGRGSERPLWHERRGCAFRPIPQGRTFPRSDGLSITHILTAVCAPVAISCIEGIGRDSLSGTESAARGCRAWRVGGLTRSSRAADMATVCWTAGFANWWSAWMPGSERRFRRPAKTGPTRKQPTAWQRSSANCFITVAERELMLPRSLTCYSARPLDADKHVKLLSSLILEGSNTSAEQRRECQNPASAHLGFSGQVMASALIDHGNQIFWTCWTIW